jgi:DNA-3-methyladenine glycosylase I
MSRDKTRCSWCEADPLYVVYHDKEWGVPERRDRALFEKLMLDGFQAGLSWLIILRKRAGMRVAFDRFDPEVMARYAPNKLALLAQDTRIVRNRAKIAAAVTNAQAYLDLREGGETLRDVLWQHTDFKPLVNRPRTLADVPTSSPQSVAMAHDLKKRGFKFCGPTICYAFMQATGMVNDHLATCFRYREIAQLR